MRYYIDTEFISGFKSSYFRLPLSYKQRHFIDLISIGIVASDGREYYAISNEFNPNDADNWVRENVLYPIMLENGYPKSLSNLHGYMSYGAGAIRSIQDRFGKSNEQIAQEILHFVNPQLMEGGYNNLLEDKKFTQEHKLKCFDPDEKCPYFIWRTQPEFYAYYASFDWTLFCSLFGRMSDLPVGFPKYVRDLKQMIDEKLENKYMTHLPSSMAQAEVNSNGNISLEDKLIWAKGLPSYPKQEKEHNAIEDARWNKKLHDFIKTL